MYGFIASLSSLNFPLGGFFFFLDIFSVYVTINLCNLGDFLLK